MNSQPQKQSLFSYVKPFLLGGTSGCITAAIIMPLDTWKVRIQIKGEDKGMHHGSNVDTHPLAIAKDLYRQDGIKGFYQGLGSALLRQITYATVRLGLYKVIADHVKSTQQRDLKLYEKILASTTSGFCGALVGNPADVCLVRFQADTSLPVNERRNYKNTLDALRRIVKDEGLVTLWRGSAPTILRAIAITIGQLTTYDEIKQFCMRTNMRQKETGADRLVASTGAGIVSSLLSLPFDNIKTKLQKMKKDQNGLLPYKGVPDCFLKTIQREGILGLWVGLPVFYLRVAPQSMLILLIQDLLHKVFEKH